MRRVTGGAVQFLTRRVIFAGENYSVWKAYRDLLKHKKENGNRKFLLEKNSTARRRRKTTRGRPNETRANDNRFHVFFGSAARAKHRAERSRTRIIFIFFYPVLAGSSARRSPVPNTISRARGAFIARRLNAVFDGETPICRKPLFVVENVVARKRQKKPLSFLLNSLNVRMNGKVVYNKNIIFQRQSMIVFSQRAQCTRVYYVYV